MYKKVFIFLTFVIIVPFVFYFFISKNIHEIDYGNGEEELIITDGKIFDPGTYEYKSIIIKGGTVTVNTSDNSQGELILKAQEKIIIEKGAKIDLSGKGYKGLIAQEEIKNPSGLSFELAGGGGSHGGCGGYGCCIQIESTKIYGFEDLNNSFGEGGGIGIKINDGRGGNGGGFIKLASPEIIINGEIMANGENGTETGGGGAGGKIVILSKRTILNGSIKTLGGKGGTSYFQGAGGGGGGIVVLNNPFQGEGSIEVSGGENGKALDYYAGCHGGKGEDGKIFLELNNIGKQKSYKTPSDKQ